QEVGLHRVRWGPSAQDQQLVAERRVARLRTAMKPFGIVGVLLIVVGLAALVYQGITYTSRETVIDIGPVPATAERQKTLPLPPVLGIAAVAGGVVLLIAGVRKHAEVDPMLLGG